MLVKTPCSRESELTSVVPKPVVSGTDWVLVVVRQ
jgi:hypothetical protein